MMDLLKLFIAFEDVFVRGEHRFSKSGVKPPHSKALKGRKKGARFTTDTLFQ